MESRGDLESLVLKGVVELGLGSGEASELRLELECPVGGLLIPLLHLTFLHFHGLIHLPKPLTFRPGLNQLPLQPANLLLQHHNILLQLIALLTAHHLLILIDLELCLYQVLLEELHLSVEDRILASQLSGLVFHQAQHGCQLCFSSYVVGQFIL